MSEEISNKYISLYEAAKYCSYSQEYLSLRARQGKFRSVKIGRNWVTTKEWVEDYARGAEEYNNKIEKAIPQPAHFATPARHADASHAGWRSVVAGPPDNLPVEFLPRPTFTRVKVGRGEPASFVDQGPLVPVPNFSEIKFQDLFPARPSAVRFGFLFALTLVLILTGAVFGKENLKSIYQDIPPINLAITAVSQTTATVFYSLSDFFQTTKNVFSQTIKNFTFALSRGINKIKEISKLVIQQPKKEGLVVIPSTGKDEEVIKKIKESFSDEVKVEPKDKTSGIIIPVFREREGEKYLYMLVPISN